jgi:hypothetical protein
MKLSCEQVSYLLNKKMEKLTVLEAVLLFKTLEEDPDLLDSFVEAWFEEEHGTKRK